MLLFFVATGCAHDIMAPLKLSGVWHVVGFGDTVSSIAARYGADTDAILELNDLPKGGALVGRQEVLCPSKAEKNQALAHHRKLLRLPWEHRHREWHAAQERRDDRPPAAVLCEKSVERTGNHASNGLRMERSEHLLGNVRTVSISWQNGEAWCVAPLMGRYSTPVTK